MAVRTRTEVVRIPEEDLISRFGIPWGVRPSQLRTPVQRATDVARPALLERLAAAKARLVSVSAPPGYGKTTLAAQYVEFDARPSTWLSVTDDGNDPISFARSLALSLSAVIPIDDALVTELTAARPRRSVVAAGFGASLRDAPGPFLLVVDDLHLLTDPAGAELLTAIADEGPPGSQVVLVSRSLGSLTLNGARLHEDLLEFDAGDLRFSVEDAGLLLRNAGAADLSDGVVAALTEQTEGWAVGLHLAALSRSSGAATDGAPPFGGDDRFVADYLREYVLAQLPDDEVDFLMRSSVLDEMSGPLCDATLLASASGARLEALEGSNMLVVPLDHRRERFRYHYLFRDLLRQELAHRSPELIPDLAARASAFCEEQGSFDLAINYALAGGLADRVAELIGRYGQLAYFTGRAVAVLRWLTWLDDHASIMDYPFVAALGGWTMAMEGRPFEAQRWADAAARSVVARSDEAEGCRLLLHAAMCRDGAESVRGDVDRALAILPPMSTWIPTARILSGHAEVLLGDADAAATAFRSSAERSANIGTAPASSTALSQLAILALVRGEVEAAASLDREAREVVDEARLHGYPTSVLTYAVAARIAVIQGDPVHARRFLQDAADGRSAMTIALPVLALQVRIQLLWTALALIDLEEAETYLVEADEIVRDCSDLGALAEELEVARNQVEFLRRSQPAIQALTPAEARLLPLLTTYLSFREIGDQLFVSQHTVKTQAISIYRKLGVTSRASAVGTARQIGLLT